MDDNKAFVWLATILAIFLTLFFSAIFFSDYNDNAAYIECLKIVDQPELCKKIK